ncbi:hypothetical protein F0230_16200 [Vibrio aestuarianus]|nr:hypothetical protein [Vibrio sp. 1180_3]NOI64089.1 hypothetical protein [Vibrio aestuarianus]
MFAISQCGVEYNDLIVHVCSLVPIVNRLLPEYSYKKTRISVRVFCNLVWCFSSTTYPREWFTIRSRPSRLEKQNVIVNIPQN